MTRLLLLVLLLAALSLSKGPVVPVWVTDSIRLNEDADTSFLGTFFQPLVKVRNRWTGPAHLSVVVRTSASFQTYDPVSLMYRRDTADLFLLLSRFPDAEFRTLATAGPILMGDSVLMTVGGLRHHEVYWYKVVCRSTNGAREIIDSTAPAQAVIGVTKRRDIEEWEEEMERRRKPVPEGPPAPKPPDSLLLLK